MLSLCVAVQSLLLETAAGRRCGQTGLKQVKDKELHPNGGSEALDPSALERDLFQVSEIGRWRRRFRGMPELSATTYLWCKRGH
jgi:hypothetical protein